MTDFEERADQLPLSIIDQTLVHGHMFEHARKKLLGPGAKLLVGPRGTGKTHVMRFAYSTALRANDKPLAFYANFNRYLNLEPLLKRSPDALKRFHSWVIAKLLLSIFEYLADSGTMPDVLSKWDPVFDQEKLSRLVSLLERSSGSEEYEDFGKDLTVAHVIKAVDILLKVTSRKRAVFLLDDAALSLADQYLIAFFDIFRLLKTENIAPKASVYPGSTQYGPTFHAAHEAESVELWLSVEDPQYSDIMGQIAERRLEGADTIGADALEFLKYVAFGVPRAYLKLLRDYKETSASTTQQKLNKVVEQHVSLIAAEYESLGIKLKQFQMVISIGRKFFDGCVLAVRDSQSEIGTTKNIILGIKQDQDRNPLAERMIRFLVEVGMLYPLSMVSHGTDRKYDRYIPHFAFLQVQGVFRIGRGTSPRDIVNYLERIPAKHPIRRELSTILSPTDLTGLQLDLPPCESCGTKRINESQLFCHNCGQELVISSLFEECMKLKLRNVPGISQALIARIENDTKIKTIGHIYASQDPSCDLQRANYVGPVRAENIIRVVGLTVNEFLT